MSTRAAQRVVDHDRQVTPRMLRLSEVAVILCLHPNTVRAWANKGLLRAYRIGRRRDRRFRVDEVMALLSAGDGAPPLDEELIGRPDLTSLETPSDPS